MSSAIIVNSNHIVDSENNSTFQIKFNRNVDFNNREIALVSATLYYSWRNITTENNRFQYKWVDGQTYDVVIPEGFYEISDINAFLQFEMRRHNHYLRTNGNNVYFIEFVVSPTQYSIDIITYPVPLLLPLDFEDPTNGNFIFSSGSEQNPTITLLPGFSELVGYEPNFTTNASPASIKVSSSTKAPNVNPNSSVIIVCDQATNDFESLGYLHTISPAVSIGSLINEKVSSPIYLKLKPGNYDSLTFRLINAKTYRPVEILDTEITLMFSVRQQK